MFDCAQIEFAMWGVRVLVIIALAAIGSYAAKSRIAFLLGFAGAFLGLVIPEPVVHAQYRDAEAAHMAGLTDAADHVGFYGIIGATVGWGSGVYLEWLRRRKRLQFGLRTVLLVMTALAAIMGVVRWFHLVHAS